MTKLEKVREKIFNRTKNLVHERCEHEKILSEEKLTSEEIKVETEYINMLRYSLMELDEVRKIIDKELYG